MASGMQESLRPLLEEALRVTEKDRARLLDRIRAENAEIGRTVASLIRAHYEKTQTIEQLMAAATARRSPARDHAFGENRIVLDRFRIVRFVGKGGMGEVYEAIDLQVGHERVALKTILGKFAGHDHILRRFTQEVQLARKVTSPNVCRVHELFLNPAGQPGEVSAFLSMEFLDGETLADVIDREGQLPLELVEAVALDVCAALAAMHSAGIIHRDLKTGNIMVVSREGARRTVVTDLGLAHEIFMDAAADRETESVITRAGAVVGTPPYMAPEQFEGRAVTPATDIYAFGIMFYEMLTGQCPFQAETPIGAAVQRGKRLPRPSSIREGVPRQWDAIFERCLEYEPGLRFQSSKEIAAILERRRWWSHGKLVAAIAAVVLLIAVAVIPWWRPYPKPSREAMQWYQRGASALRDGTWLGATNALARAVALTPDFALAHAGLAHAWAELDFTGKAQDEILRASALEARWKFPRRDREYVDAVRATLTRDFTSAIRDYSAILGELPPSEKASGYIDLGSAYEKATNIPEALKCYSEAARRDPEDPAAFVHIGILNSRGGNVAEGEKAFARANELYQAASNLEGIAEVDYQRGYSATVHGDLKAARDFLEQSMRAAQEIPSLQLQIRVLTRLGAAQEEAGKLDQAIETENRAIVLARENGLDYWAIDGLMRLANAYLLKGDYTSAETPLQKALRLAHDSQRLRLKANARATLAEIRQQQGRTDEAIQFALPALNYYQEAGFAEESAKMLILLGWSKLQKGDLKGALADARNAVAPAQKSGAPLAVLQAKELIGTVLLDLERYPEALVHLQPALDSSRAIGQDVDYNILGCAEVLWRLGRYQEANALLGGISPQAARQPDIRTELTLVRARIALSRRNFRDARAFAGRALQIRDLPADKAADAGAICAIALAGLHARKEAERAAEAALVQSRQSGSPESSAQASLAAAEVWLASGSADRARTLAESAFRFFSSSEQEESHLLALLDLARIAELSGNLSTAAEFASKGMDILAQFQHTWGTSIYGTYMKRPDMSFVREQLIKLIKQRRGA